MDLDSLGKGIELLSSLVVLIAGILAAIWAYTKYVLERGLLPPIQFDIECKLVGIQANKKVLEILIHLKNIGSSTLIATNIRADIRYMVSDDDPSVFSDSSKPTFGRLCFPNSLRRELEGTPVIRSQSPQQLRGMQIVPYDTFVQPGIDQTYTLVTALPKTTTFALIWAQFEYAQHPSLPARFALFLSRRIGLIQYSLLNVRVPHTIERVFDVSE